MRSSSSSSAVVDIENPSGGTSSPREAVSPSFWSRFKKAVNVVEESIANFFGLNESKYQWALDEYMKQQLSGDTTSRPKLPTTEEEDQSGMQPTGLQIMDRNSSKAR